MHVEAQDQSVAGWEQVTNLIERLARTSVAILEPSAQIPWEDWMRVITLPPEVAGGKTRKATEEELKGVEDYVIYAPTQLEERI
jgi:hypothetical protein